MKDMKAKARTTAGALASLTMVASMSAMPALAAQQVENPDVANPAVGEAAAECTMPATMVKAKAVGTFSYDQGVVTPNATIKNTFQKATRTLCGAGVPLEVANPFDWEITVSGAVDDAYTAPVSELASDSSVQQKMTCTCGGNPAGGRAIITADVKGIPIEAILSRAGVQRDANAVTFISADGTEVMLPLGYVVGRHAVISYEINDEDLAASVGGSNQLWMTRTPANYFVRDVVEIVVSAEDEAPAVPGENDEHPNSPNAGLLAGAQA